MLQFNLILILALCAVVAIGVALYPLRQQKFILLFGVGFLLILFTIAGYWRFGAFAERQAYLQRLLLQQHAKELSVKGGVSELIQRMQAHLQKHPQQQRGWYLLGRLYASQQQWHLASKAFHQAVQLQPDDEQAVLNEVQSLQMLNNQQLNTQLRHMLQDVLHSNPNQADALLMLAIDADKMHKYEISIGYWEKLLAIVPEQSAEAPMIRKALSRAYRRAHLRQQNTH